MASSTSPSKRSKRNSGQLQEKEVLSSKNSTPQDDLGRPSSPDPVCAICLGKHENKCYADSCLHKFCFRCLQEWSKVKAECPLCKQPFSSIFYNVKSDQEYDEYKVPVVEAENPSHSMLDSVHRRFHYRTTMTQERRGALALERLMLIRQFADDILPTAQARPRRSRLSGTSNFRRQIYERDLWVRPLSDITGRYRETTPEFFQLNPAMTHRLVPWLNRELNCLLTRPENRLSYVLDMILRLITQHHICSRPFREALQQYLGANTEHFIHEFFQYSRSPYDMYGFDEYAHYEPRTRFIHEEVAVDESSSDEEDVGSRGVIGRGPQVDIPLPPSPQPGPSGLNREYRAQLSDDGQSYTPRMPRAASASEVSTTPSTGSGDADEEVEVVEVVRPRHERTPEIITLSDTEAEEDVADVAEESNASDSRSLRGKALKRRMKSPVRCPRRERKEKRLREPKRRKREPNVSRDRDRSPSRPLRYWDLDPEQVRHVLHKRHKRSSSNLQSSSADRNKSRKS